MFDTVRQSFDPPYHFSDTQCRYSVYSPIQRKQARKEKQPMDSDIDKKMRPIIEKFNISKHVKTVFCCAGHKCRREDGYPNWAIVYIVFEMDKEQVGTFLDLAFTSLTKKMFVHNLCLRLSRSFYCQKALKNRERVVLQFYNDESQLSMKQIRLARNYFMNLAEKAVAAL